MSLSDPSSSRGRGMTLRSGVHREMEDAANEILRQSLSTVTRHRDKADILTPWKEQARRGREVFVPSGTPDAALRKGTFGRALNPTHAHLNSAEGVVPPKANRNYGASPWDSE